MTRRNIFYRSLLFSFCLFSSNLFAQSQAPCSTDEYRQFDFWIGEWKVTGAGGNIAGANNITRSHNGCTISEHYKTPTGYEGNSYNIYDRVTKQWHQTWVDNTGLLLTLKGSLQDGAMVLSGKGKLPTGEKVTHRITWTPNEDGSVRQHWETSKDNGESWNTAFDGHYTKP